MNRCVSTNWNFPCGTISNERLSLCLCCICDMWLLSVWTHAAVTDRERYQAYLVKKNLEERYPGMVRSIMGYKGISITSYQSVGFPKPAKQFPKSRHQAPSLMRVERERETCLGRLLMWVNALTSVTDWLVRLKLCCLYCMLCYEVSQCNFLDCFTV